VIKLVLFAIIGELGSGKTLLLAYLAWNNYYKKQRAIFSNFNLYGFPFTKITSIPSLDKMHEGFFAADELWLWIDARCTKQQKARVVSNILLKSRKRGITIAYTSQTIEQIEPRIRKITDFTAYPMMNVDNSVCKALVFKGVRPSPATYLKSPIYFMIEPTYALYDTYEEIEQIEEADDNFNEQFLPIESNPAWLRYLRDNKGITNSEQIKAISDSIQKAISRQEEPQNLPSGTEDEF
jgi:hypothetical protein